MLARFAGAAATVALLMATAAGAQNARDPFVPAELPPASFDGVQYVDSTGCAFIRAGVSGVVNWVPRFDRDRNPVCGLRPTLAANAAPTGAQAPAVAAAPRADAPRTAAQRDPKEPPAMGAVRRPQPQQAQVAHHAQMPRAGAAAPAAPVRVAGQPVAQGHGNTCPNYDPIALRWTTAPPGVHLRCGAQLVHPSDGRRTDGPGGRVWHPHSQQHHSLPPGYKPAWRDGRLNPYRGQGTPEGEAAMRRVWDDGVPMALRQPVARQAELPYGGRVHPIATTPDGPAASATTLSTRGQATAQPAAVPATGRFVQVASFGQPANARNTAARFQAMGLPVRLGHVQRGGQRLEVVMIGPLSSSAEAGAALQAARQAGFADAFLRG